VGAFAFGRSGGVIRQCGGTLTSPLERMRMTYNPTFFFRVAESDGHLRV